MTINNSQGQTMQMAGLFLRPKVFTHGQLYVAKGQNAISQGGNKKKGFNGTRKIARSAILTCTKIT